MHQTRAEVSTKIPISRKGTKYVARALSHNDDGVPVVIAIRDMLKLASTAKEVKEMIKQKLLKINGKTVRDYRETIKLFNILEAGKNYKLTLSPARRFAFAQTAEKERLCKVVGKRLLKEGKVQLNLHDGSNLQTSDKINVTDSVYLDMSSKIKSHVSLGKANKVFIISGKYLGKEAKLEKLEGTNVYVNVEDKETVLHARQVVAL